MAAQQRRYATPTKIRFCSDDDEEEVEEEQCTRSPSLVGSEDEYADSCSTRKRSRPASSVKANRSSVTGRVWNEEEEITLLEHLIAKVTREQINNLFPNKEKEQIRRKIRHLREKFQKHKGGAKFTNLHHEKLYDLSNIVWGENTTTTTTNSDKEGGQEKDSMNVDDDVVGDEEDTVEINDDVILMGLDEYLARRSLHNISEELRRKLESKWRRLAYERARYDLAGCFAARVILASGLLPALHSLDIREGLTRAILPGMIFGDRMPRIGFTRVLEAWCRVPKSPREGRKVTGVKFRVKLARGNALMALHAAAGRVSSR
ncbi:hypothetical protein ACLB2K_007025 [Fragaria x ananassa]